MNPLTPGQFAGLLSLIESTADQEINCEQFLASAAEYAEHQLAGRELDTVLAKVAHHLKICAECREEFLALQRILGAG